jgi:hypothetical protein
MGSLPGMGGNGLADCRTTLNGCGPPHKLTVGDVGDFIAGVIDAYSLRMTRVLRRSLPGGDPRNICSGYYRAGEWASLGIGASRLAYAGTAKALPLLVEEGDTALETAQNVFNARNALKTTFRAGTFPNSRMYTWEQIDAKYGGDAAKIVGAATRTNPLANASGATATAGASIGLARGCHE